MLLLAPPGAGKGTQGERLAAHYSIRHISSGDVLRRELEAGTEVGLQAKRYLSAGDLVPDEVMETLLQQAVVAAAAQGGYVLDGYPRNLAQAESARLKAEPGSVGLQAVLHLEVPEAELIRRLLERGRGSDDTAETIAHRLEVYARETQPLVDNYRERGLLLTVDGTGPVEKVTDACLEALSALVP